jgi:thiamine biosynthesis lipoprotein
MNRSAFTTLARPARFLALLAAVVLAVGLAGCKKKSPYVQQMAFIFGTMVEISIWGEEPPRGRELANQVFAELEREHRLLHPWQPGPMAELNAAIAAGQQDLAVDPEIARLLRDASAAAAQSEQLFNPAIGKLVALWGFHADTPGKVVPKPEAVDALVKAQPRMTDLKITENRLSSSNPAVQIDLGGYAKGYALDRAAQLLRQAGVPGALINIGGNVLAIGSKGGEAWRVGIQHPRRPSSMAAIALLDGEAVGTSGDYQRYFEVGSRRYSHLIDPRNGQPGNDLASVTVLVTPRPDAGTFSDWTSKPLFIAGRAEWPLMARKIGVTHALVLPIEGEAVATEAMRARLIWDDKNGPLRVVP